MRVFLSRACKQVSPPETMKQRLFIAAKAFLLHEHTSYVGCANFYNVSETSLKRMISEFRATDAHMALLKKGSPSLTAAIGTASSSDSTPSSPVDPASAPVDRISTPVDYGLNSKGMPHTPYTAAYKWAAKQMGDGMSARKAATACQTKFQVEIGKTTLQNGLNKGKVNTPEKPGRPTHLPEDAERHLANFICALRSMKIPVFMHTLMTYANAMIKGTEFEVLFAKGQVSRGW